VAGVIVGLVALLHLWWDARRKRKLAALASDPGAPSRAASSRNRPLGLALSHRPHRRIEPLLLDWTNNYGLRPFFPFNPAGMRAASSSSPNRFYGAAPGGDDHPALLGLIGGEIGARSKPFRGRGWAIFALVGTVIVWGWRWSEHAQALALVENAQVASQPVKRMAAEPYPVDPFRWHVIIETADFYQTAEVNTRTGEIASDPQRDVMYKPPTTAAVEAAKQTPLGKVYLDWGTWA